MALTGFQRAVCRLLAEKHGYDVRVVRKRPAFVETEVTKTSDSVLMQWMRDSAYRFFPLVQHEGLAAAEQIVDALPPPEVGRCVLGEGGRLFAGDVESLRAALHGGELVFPGRIRGALPQVKE
jgi:hypothetical protein